MCVSLTAFCWFNDIYRFLHLNEFQKPLSVIQKLLCYLKFWHFCGYSCNGDWWFTYAMQFLDGWVIFAEYARPRPPPGHQNNNSPPFGRQWFLLFVWKHSYASLSSLSQVAIANHKLLFRCVCMMRWSLIIDKCFNLL